MKPDGAAQKRNPSPLTSTNIISRITYWWITRLIITAWRNTGLKEPDVWDLPEQEQTDAVVSPFLAILEKQGSKYAFYCCHRPISPAHGPQG